MEYVFPRNIRIRKMRHRLEGLRQQPFMNIDGETFSRPALNGFWRVDMDLMAATEDEYLALTSFLTAMRGNATTLIPMTTRFLPNDASGRKLHGYMEAPEFGSDHTGFLATPFEGFKLRAAVSHRDSYIDVNGPTLSRLRPGHMITLGDKLYQVVNVSAIGESTTASRVSVMPNIRGGHATGTVVVVDYLRLRAKLEDAGDPDTWNIPVTEVSATFIEAF